MLQHKCDPIDKRLHHLDNFKFKLVSNIISLDKNLLSFPSTQPHIAGSSANLFDIFEGVQGLGVGFILNCRSAGLKPAKVDVGKRCREVFPNLTEREKITQVDKYR